MDMIPRKAKGAIVSSGASMLSQQNANSHSEHDLFIRLFLTGGGGW
jgi:hypothetical protein